MDQLKHFLNTGLPTGKKSIKQYTLPGSNTLNNISNNFLHNKINLHTQTSNITLPKNKLVTRMPTNIHHQRLSQFIKMDRHSYNDAPGEVKRGGQFDASKVTPLYNADAQKFIAENAKSLIAGTTLTPETKAQLDPYIKFGGAHVDVAGGTNRFLGGTGYQGPDAPALNYGNTNIIYRDSNTGQKITDTGTQNPFFPGMTTVKPSTPKSAPLSITPSIVPSGAQLSDYTGDLTTTLSNQLGLSSGSSGSSGSSSSSKSGSGYSSSSQTTSRQTNIPNTTTNIPKPTSPIATTPTKVSVPVSTVPKPSANAAANISAIDKAASSGSSTAKSSGTPTFAPAPAPKPTLIQKVASAISNIFKKK